MKKLLPLLLTLLCVGPLAAQHTTEITIADDEYWWGAVVGYGSRMPYVEPVETFNLASRNDNNQVVPLLLSSKGRYLWSDYPFRFTVADGRIT